MDASRRSVIFHADERGFAYSESVWSWHPWAGAKSAGMTCSQATVTKRSWTPGRARHKRSNHRAGNVDVSASPVVTTLVCFSSSHTGLRVQQNTRHSLRPLFFRGWAFQDSGEIAPRE